MASSPPFPLTRSLGRQQEEAAKRARPTIDFPHSYDPVMARFKKTTFRIYCDNQGN